MRTMNILKYLALCSYLLIDVSAKKIPKNDDISGKTVSDYERNRTKLLQQEYKLSLGGKVKLCHDENLLNNILMKLKEEEFNQSFYNPERFNFSKHYFVYKDYLENSKVYQIIKRMPKGAALHIHTTFALDGNYLLNLTYEDHLYACYTGSNLRFQFSDSTPDQPCEYEWTLMSELRKASDNVTELDRRIKRFLTLDNSDEDYGDLDTSNTSWKKFHSLYPATKSLMVYRPITEKIFYDILQKFYDDNIMYIEIRGGAPLLYELDGTQHDDLYTVKLHRDVTKRFIEDHPDFVGVKFIFAGHRRGNIEEITSSLDQALRIKNEFPEFIAGFDLVGQEDIGKPLNYFLPALLEYKDKLSYYFHAGETNWFGTESDENLIDAILLGTKRIGHGYALTKHPVLMSIIKKYDIAIEVNVISNAVLGLVKDVRNHPLATFLSLGLPVVLSSDDPGAWGAEPLSHDFYISFMAVASKHADLRVLKQLALNSIKYSALGNIKKASFYRIFNKRWDDFVRKVISEKFFIS